MAHSAVDIGHGGVDDFLAQGIADIMSGDLWEITPEQIVLADGQAVDVAAKILENPATPSALIAVGLARYVTTDQVVVVAERHTHPYDARPRAHHHYPFRCVELNLANSARDVAAVEPTPNAPRRLAGTAAQPLGGTVLRDLIHSDRSNDLFGSRPNAARRLLEAVDISNGLDGGLFVSPALQRAVAARIAQLG